MTSYVSFYYKSFQRVFSNSLFGNSSEYFNQILLRYILHRHVSHVIDSC
jgi:hypothetical protein